MEEVSLNMAHESGMYAYERRRAKGFRVDVRPPNPYGHEDGASIGWAWDCGWRLAAYLEAAG